MKGFLRGAAGLLLACLITQNVYAVEDKSGIVLTFDDTYVDHWYDYFGQRTDNDTVKATFFVSYWHELPAAKIEKLRQLRDKGHEIGSHSHSHEGVAGDYNFDPNRIQEYLDSQIIPSLLNMQADGFDPVSFSYPSGERNEVYDAAVRQYFPYLRTTFADEERELFQMDDIFHGPDSQYQVLAGDGIDNAYNNPIEEIESAFLRAKTNNEIVILYAHRILADDSPDADYRFGVRVSKLDRLINAAKEMGLKFYTFEEAWQIGNQDAQVSAVNAAVEAEQVRVTWENVNADFVGVVPVGQNEWLNGMPGISVTGTSGDVTIGVPATDDDQAYIAILYNNFSEVGRSSPVTIIGNDSSGGTDETASPNITYLGLQEGKARFQWQDLPTDFIGIVPVGETVWSEGMYGADAHGDASSKIGFRIVSEATDRQYTAIFYRNAVEVGRSIIFTIAGTGGTDTGGTDTGGTDTGGTDTGGTDTGGTDTGGTDTGGSASSNIVYLGFQEGKARFQWSDLPTDAIGIVPVTENEWQPGMPWAEVNGLAADKIGFRITPEAIDRQYVAIFYQNSVEIGRSVIFTIAGTDTGGTDTGGTDTGGTDTGGTDTGGTDTGGTDTGGTDTGGTDTGASPAVTYLGYQEGKARFQWSDLPTDVIGIVPVTQNEWQPGMPWADVRGAAGDKIGFSITPEATDQQYVAIFYRDSVEVGRSIVFTINGNGI